MQKIGKLIMTKMECCGPGYSSPAEAIKAPAEKLLYSIAIYTGTGIQKPDYLATVDVDPESPYYSKVIHRLELPGIARCQIKQYSRSGYSFGPSRTQNS